MKKQRFGARKLLYGYCWDLTPLPFRTCSRGGSNCSVRRKVFWPEQGLKLNLPGKNLSPLHHGNYVDCGVVKWVKGGALTWLRHVIKTNKDDCEESI